MRTVDMFSGKTKLEEVEALLADEAPAERPEGPRDLVAEHQASLPTWLGLDTLDVAGDDLVLVIAPKGHGVLQVIGPRGSSVRELGLSRKQIQKLRTILR
jgi:hypothetical protein